MSTYRVNDIFYSLQGEGFWTGTPMVFLRLAGCNLRCPFCDTDFSASHEMSAHEIIASLEAAYPSPVIPDSSSVIPGLTRNLPPRRLCITGGEPSLQLDEPLVKALHQAGYRIHLETNGTRPIPPGVDWVTLSPKEDFCHFEPCKGEQISFAGVVLPRADELKLVYTGANDPEKWLAFPADHYFLQPCDPGEICPTDGGEFRTLDEDVDTVAATLRYTLSHPRWRLSLQTHKILGIA